MKTDYGMLTCIGWGLAAVVGEKDRGKIRGSQCGIPIEFIFSTDAPDVSIKIESSCKTTKKIKYQ